MIICNCDLSIGHGGIGDIAKHVQSAKHVAKVGSSAPLRKIEHFFADSKDLSVMLAEALFTAQYTSCMCRSCWAIVQENVSWYDGDIFFSYKLDRYLSYINLKKYSQQRPSVKLKLHHNQNWLGLCVSQTPVGELTALPHTL